MRVAEDGGQLRQRVEERGVVGFGGGAVEREVGLCFGFGGGFRVRG